MPKPIKEELLKYAEQHPPKARVILEAITVESEDIKDTKADWDGADSTTGWATLGSGGAKPAGSVSNKINYATGTGDAITSFPGLAGSPVPVMTIRWSANTQDETFQDITSFTARLDPDADGVSGKNVQHYIGQLFRVAVIEDDDWTLEQITPPVWALAPGTVGEVTFPINGLPAKVNIPPVGETRPYTVIVIRAVKSDGTDATNVAWIGTTGSSSTTVSGHTVATYNLVSIGGAGNADNTYTKKQIQSRTGLGRFAIKGPTFTQQTIAFTGSSAGGNAPRLAATPTGTVEFVLEDEEPGGSSGQGYVRNAGSLTWVAFTDGQTVDDLAGVTSTGPVYEMRYIATPSTSGFLVPTVRRMGVRELARETLDGIARIGNPMYELDPFSLKASIPTLSFELTRDGVLDYRDYATELFSDNHPGGLEFRVWYGHPDLDRQYWTLLDQYRLNNYDAAGDSIVVDCLHPLALLKKTIPAASTGGMDAVVFNTSTVTIASAYQSILDTAGVPDRYHGVRVTLDSTSAPDVGKIISRERPAKEETDRLAFIEGGAVIPSGGRLKWKRIWSSTGALYNSPSVTFENIAPTAISPNLDRRIISYRAPYGYSDSRDNNRGGFSNAAFVQSTAAQSKLGHADLYPVQNLDDETAQWIKSSTYASAIARRTVAAFRQGAVMLSFRSDHPRPWVELGDTVEVRTDRFVGRTLEGDRALRGRIGVLGVVVGHDLNGEQFTVWVPDIENARSATPGIAIDYARPEVFVTAVRAEAAGTNADGDQLFTQKFTIRTNFDTQSIRVQRGALASWSIAESTGGTSSFTNQQYIWNDFTPGTEFEHVVRDRAGTGSGPVASSTDAFEFYRIQQSSTGTISDIEDANDGWAPLDNLSFWFYPYSKSTGSGVVGTAKIIEGAPLQTQTSASEFTDGTNTYHGGSLRVGSGLTLSLTTDGIPQIALST